MDKRLLGELRLVRLAFGAAVGLSLLGGLLVIAQAAFLSRIINRVFLEGASRNAVSSLFLWIVVIILLRALNQIGLQLFTGRVALRIKETLRRRLVDHLFRLGPAYTGQERSGELALALTDGIEALDSFFREYLPALFVAVLIPLAILFVVFPLDFLTFVVLLVTAPLIPLFMVLIGQAAGALAKSRYARLGQMSAHFLDVMQGLTTLKLFNRSKAQIATIARITDQYRESTLAVLRVAFLSAFTLELLATISVAVVAVEIGLRLLAGGIRFEQALFLLVIAPDFYLPLRQLAAKFHAGRDGTAAAERIYAILNAPLSATSGTEAVPAYHRIQFDRVSVSFADNQRPALQDFSLIINRGEHVALVGATGSGKSTVFNLLLCFLEPDQGVILLPHGAGMMPLGAVNADRWRDQLSWVPQRGYLFDLSVAENMRLARPVVSEQEMVTAARSAAAHDFITRLPQGYDTELGENATVLSGGQAQRLALARAFVRQSPLYLFDEATANLDSENEQAIQQALAALPAGTTIVTIAHRLETIRQADKIVVLDRGRIVETGRHEALIQNQGAYFQLLQAWGAGIDG